MLTWLWKSTCAWCLSNEWTTEACPFPEAIISAENPNCSQQYNRSINVLQIKIMNEIISKTVYLLMSTQHVEWNVLLTSQHWSTCALRLSKLSTTERQPSSAAFMSAECPSYNICHTINYPLVWFSMLFKVNPGASVYHEQAWNVRGLKYSLAHRSEARHQPLMDDIHTLLKWVPYCHPTQ